MNKLDEEVGELCTCLQKISRFYRKLICMSEKSNGADLNEGWYRQFRLDNAR